MLLFELLDNPVRWDQTWSSDEHLQFEFTLPDGREYMVNLILGDETRKSSIPIFELNFYDKADDRANVDRYAKNNKGSELTIFATVIDIVQTFLLIETNAIVEFAGMETNRNALYHRLLTRYIKPPLAFTANPPDFYVGPQAAIDELDS